MSDANPATPSGKTKVRGRVVEVIVKVAYDFDDGKPTDIVTQSIDVDRYIALCWRPPNDIDVPHESAENGVPTSDSILGRFYANGVRPHDAKDANGVTVRSSQQIIDHCRARHGVNKPSQPNKLTSDDVQHAWNQSKLSYRMSSPAIAVELLPAAIIKGRPCDFDAMY